MWVFKTGFLDLLSICGQTVEVSDIRWAWCTRKEVKGVLEQEANCENRLCTFLFEGVLDGFVSTCSPIAVRQLKKVISGGHGVPEKR